MWRSYWIEVARAPAEARSRTQEICYSHSLMAKDMDEETSCEKREWKRIVQTIALG
jgi:hypothetical protein